MKINFPFVIEQNVPRLLNAVSAFDLLDIVKVVVREDARCYNSAEWISPPGYGLSAAQRPECGTVACIAGWMVLLMRGTLKLEDMSGWAFFGVDYNAGDVAGAMMGMTWDEVDGLFEAASRADSSNAALGIWRIEGFQHLHRERLKATMIEPDAAEQIMLKRLDRKAS